MQPTFLLEELQAVSCVPKKKKTSLASNSMVLIWQATISRDNDLALASN